MHISSGSVFGPVQPQDVPDFSALNDKNFYSQMTSSDYGGTQAINYGNNAMGGTDFASLTGTPADTGNMSEAQMQGLAQLLAPQLQGLIQLLSLLQQLISGQQGDNSTQAGAGNNSGNGAGWPGASAQEQTGEPPLATPANATTQPPVTAPANSPAPTNASLSTPTQESAPTSGSGIPTTQGSSGLHLPQALQRYEKDIMRAARETQIPPEILAGQIWQESRGKADAVTTNGGNGLSDSGVMQVNSNTFADLQSKNSHLLGPNASPSNSSDSIMAGALYMKEQLNAFGGNMGAALRAYNSGPGNVNVNDLTDISKTGTGDATYVEKVLKFADIISSGNGTLPA
ncbi:lytic transglycosylase domain-containing protein [Vagococcus sp. WN89Y]|uniref:lytic transglycosylase domain-containing protein n=1 Tax=Vagococcus sp. WN89Y TaxID=3457258 RepID=UPI003FCCECAA